MNPAAAFVDGELWASQGVGCSGAGKGKEECGTELGGSGGGEYGLALDGVKQDPDAHGCVGVNPCCMNLKHKRLYFFFTSEVFNNERMFNCFHFTFKGDLQILHIFMFNNICSVLTKGWFLDQLGCHAQ